MPAVVVETPLAEVAALEHISRAGCGDVFPVGQSASNPVKRDQPGRLQANLPVVVESAVPCLLQRVSNSVGAGFEKRG